jgi:hypothetical protein
MSATPAPDKRSYTYYDELKSAPEFAKMNGVLHSRTGTELFVVESDGWASGCISWVSWREKDWLTARRILLKLGIKALPSKHEYFYSNPFDPEPVQRWPISHDDRWKLYNEAPCAYRAVYD